jgi:hypothetical protein
MTRSLSKAPIRLSVTYSDDEYSNNLTGCNIELNELHGSLCLCIDMVRNLRVRNKQENCYSDACRPVKRHESLSSVQIDDENVLQKLAAAWRRQPHGRWELQLDLGESRVFKYAVKPRSSAGSIVLEVASVV